ncbi:MAG: hypothetical protein CMJ18_16125 [Phycisphaeraceae bacterium]|nr:hypothetical protein [Phycisphaeraceae bacterium]
MCSLLTETREADEQSPARLVINPLAWWNWWLTLIAPAGIGAVYLFHSLGWHVLIAKPNAEALALYLATFACGVYAHSAITTRDPLHMILGALSVAFLCREIHFTGSGPGIYVTLAVLAIWTVLWRNRLVVPLERGQTKAWLASTALLYVLSQAIARRAFAARHLGLLPIEETMHVPLEEFLENVGHLSLIVTSFAGRFRPIRRAARAE